MASEEDVNEVITPEASFSGLEPTVMVSAESTASQPGPTSDPYGGQQPTYYNDTGGPASHGLSRYTLGDVAGVCDTDMNRSCSWHGSQDSQHH